MTRPLKGHALVLGSALLLGTLGVFSKLFYDAGGEPFILLFLRFAAGGPLLVLIALARREQWPPRRRIALGASLGVLQLLVAFALFEGFARAPVGLVVLVFFCYPLIVAVAAAFLFGEELGPRRVGVLALGTAGVALTVGLPDSANATGIALGLLAGICVAGLVISARALTTMGGINRGSTLVSQSVTRQRFGRFRSEVLLQYVQLGASAATVGLRVRLRLLAPTELARSPDVQGLRSACLVIRSGTS